MSTSPAIYHSIALDIAQRIINGDFPVGGKISGRSLLAGHYNVSPETIRKAVALLKDANVLSVSQGKEIRITSAEQAYYYIEHHKSMHSVYSLKQDLELLLQRKQETDRQLEDILTNIISYSDRLKNLTPYNPVEIKIPFTSHVVGKTIMELKLWQNTGATLVAIRRGSEIIVSPGPLAVLQGNDQLVVVGQAGFFQRFTDYIQTPAADS